MKCMFKHQDLQMFSLKLNRYEYVRPLEVLGRDTETQLEVDENFNYLIERLKG